MMRLKLLVVAGHLLMSCAVLGCACVAKPALRLAKAAERCRHTPLYLLL